MNTGCRTVLVVSELPDSSISSVPPHRIVVGVLAGGFYECIVGADGRVSCFASD